MNNRTTLKKYILNRKSCPKCFKTNLVAYFSPGRHYKYNKAIFTTFKNMITNYMSTIYMPYKSGGYYRQRIKTVKNINHNNFNMVEVVCEDCYFEFEVYFGF